jgi:DNA-directed RNA polymerase I, II, and III subunit RPABC2
MDDNVVTSGLKKENKKSNEKIKAKVMDDVEDAELAVEKKPLYDNGEENNENVDDDTLMDSDYEGDWSDEDVDFSEDIKKITNQPLKENLNNTNYYRSIKVTPDNMRVTSDIMTMFEFSEVIGIRTLQIEKGSPLFTDVSDLNIPYDMAIKELFDRKSPLKIIRKISKFEQEEWKCNEMGFPFDTRSLF